MKPLLRHILIHVVIVLFFLLCFFPISGASMYNLYDEEEEDSQKPVSQETMKENKVTMNKMKLLRHKLESQKLTKVSEKMGTMRYIKVVHEERLFC